MSKITVKRKDKDLIRTELRHRYLLWKLPRYLKVIPDGVFKKITSTDKNIFNVSNKVTSAASVEAFIIRYFLCT